MSLLDKIKKNSTVKETSVLETSKFFVDKEIISTSVPIFNVALSGALDGGFSSSITVLSGASRSFKTSFALLMAKAYLDKYKDSVLLFYDSEFGSPQKYFKSFGIDLTRVIHTPLATLEELRHDIMQQFANIERGDRVMVLIDSISNLPSIAEAENAEAGKNTADLQRNKVLKSIFRLITPQFTRKDIPGVVIAHSYQTMEMFCLDGETKIKTINGIKPIRDIYPGEFVYTNTGVKEVTNKYMPEDLPSENVKYLKLIFDDGSHVKCTDTHKFLMDDNKWVRAGDIKVGDVFY